jgi:hypothetical protein
VKATAVEVKERPILMSGPMVKAILEERKTQTRRVIKHQPPKEAGLGLTVNTYSEPDYYQALFFRGPTVESTGMGEPVKCPYGKPGDRLWVRETFSYVTKAKSEVYDKVRPDGCPVEMYHQADWQHDFDFPANWTPSIFMPRWASRITLEVTNVRVERLQDITEADAIAEGVYTNEQAIEKLGLPPDTKLSGSCVDKYRIVWESINGKKYPWASNPWVWCISFRRIENAC